MGVVRRGLAGALSGLGTGIGNTSSAFLQHIFHGEDMDKENALLLARQRQEAIPRLGEFMGTHPELADSFEAFGQKNGMNLSPFHVSDQDRLSPLIHSINAAPDELHTPSVADLTAGVKNTERPGLNTPVMSSTLAPGAPSPAPPAGIASPLDQGENIEIPRPKAITDLIAARQAHLDAIQQQREITNQELQAKAKAEATGKGLGETAPDVVQGDVNKQTAMIPGAVAQAGRISGAQFDATHTPARMQAEARGRGMTAGAEARSRFPFEASLAKTKADQSLLDKKAFEDYKLTHPQATATERDRANKATVANGMIESQIMPMLEEMDKRGMLGPMAGRLDELFTNKAKTSELFKNPQDAQLAARFMDDSKLLSSLVANVHGGQRAVSGDQSRNYFQGIFNGIGDAPILRGQLGSIHDLMNRYAQHPESPDFLPIPGFSFTGNNTNTSSGLDPSLDEILNRSKKGGPH